MTVPVGRIGVWTAVFESHPAAAAQAAAQEIESLGYSALLINETTGSDPFVMSALLLSATTTLTVATGIANVFARDAMSTAACQKTLAEAFPGRFLLGLGVSSPALVQHVRQHLYDKPFSYISDYLAAMDEAPFHAAAPAGDTGRVLAALGPRMLALSAQRADGAHPYLTTPDHTRTAREIIGPSALLAPEQMVVLKRDPERARTIGRAALRFYLRAPGYLANLRRLGFDDDDWADPKAASHRLVDGIIAWGDVDAITSRVQEHIDAGADHVCVQVLRHDRELPLHEWRARAGSAISTLIARRGSASEGFGVHDTARRARMVAISTHRCRDGGFNTAGVLGPSHRRPLTEVLHWQMTSVIDRAAAHGTTPGVDQVRRMWESNKL